MLKLSEFRHNHDPSGVKMLAKFMRHTLHHQGQLAVLAVFHGLEGGSWE